MILLAISRCDCYTCRHRAIAGNKAYKKHRNKKYVQYMNTKHIIQNNIHKVHIKILNIMTSKIKIEKINKNKIMIEVISHEAIGK